MSKKEPFALGEVCFLRRNDLIDIDFGIKGSKALVS